jgi:hypothetical protein
LILAIFASNATKTIFTFQLIPNRRFVGKKNLLRHRVSKGQNWLHIEIGASIAALTWYQLLIRILFAQKCQVTYKTFYASGCSKDFRVQFEGGVIIAADTLGSYGSLAKITNLDRVIKVRNINLQYIRSLNAAWYW